MELLITLLPALITLVKIFGSIISILLVAILGLGRYIWKKFEEKIENLEKAIVSSQKEARDDLKIYRAEHNAICTRQWDIHNKEHEDIWEALDKCLPRNPTHNKRKSD